MTTASPVNFTEFSSPKFKIYVGFASPEGSYYFVPEDTTTPPDPIDTHMCPSVNIIMITHGKWKLEGVGIPNKEMTLIAGQGPFARRFRCKQRFVTLEMNSGLTCIYPRDGEIWGRAALNCNSGDEMPIDPRENCTERYIIPVIGSITTDNGFRVPTNTPLRVPVEGGVSFIANEPVMAVELWK